MNLPVEYDVRLSVRLPAEDNKQLQMMAEHLSQSRMRVTVSDIVRALIKRYLDGEVKIREKDLS